MPTSNTRSGISLAMMFIEQPVGMAGVTPTILGFCLASSSKVFPKTSWYFIGWQPFESEIRSPVAASKRPGACHTVAFFSAGA